MVRVLYIGQKWIGEKCFAYLHSKQSDSLQICGAVSNISADVWWKSNGIYTRCLDGGVPFLSNERRNNDQILKMIADFDINTIFSVQHRWILPRTLLESVKYRAFNLHNAKLPDYKGNNICNHAILNRDRRPG